MAKVVFLLTIDSTIYLAALSSYEYFINTVYYFFNCALDEEDSIVISLTPRRFYSGDTEFCAWSKHPFFFIPVYTD